MLIKLHYISIRIIPILMLITFLCLHVQYLQIVILSIICFGNFEVGLINDGKRPGPLPL